MRRTFKVIQLPKGRIDHVIAEIIIGPDRTEEVGDEFLSLHPKTPPQTVFDVTMALQKAYAMGRADQKAEDEERK